MNVYEHEYFLWGTGEDATNVNEWFQRELEQIKIIGYIDSDTKKENKFFFGKKIFSPRILNDYTDCKIVINTNKYRKEVIAQIENTFPQHKKNICEEYFWKRLQLINRYKICEDKSISDIIDFLLYNPLSFFNYEWREKYQENDINALYDDENGLFYVLYNGKKMYLSRAYDTENKVKEYIKGILIEQDEQSPHRYLSDNFDVDEESVVVDAGVAEGNFALDIIDRVKHIYLFEPDPLWVEALQHTFKPFEKKVSIIEKGISNYTGWGITTLDAELLDTEINFIKLDVEGEEVYALKGAKNLIDKSSNIKCAVCAYHQEFSYEAICALFYDMGFNIETTRGYMFYPTNDFQQRPPILRHGLVRVKKEFERQCLRTKNRRTGQIN